MIRAYDKDNMTFITYDWGYVANKDEIEFNADTRIVEKYNLMDNCEAFVVLNDTKSETSLLLQARTLEVAKERLERAVIDGYLTFTAGENPVEVYTDAFDIIEA